MLKQNINYVDWDDKPQTETLYFNLTKTELADNLHLKEDLDMLHERITGETRELTIQEVQKILDLVKTFMRLSYGIRSEDGRRFIKTPDIWVEFTQTAAYDAFLTSLFQDPNKAVEFLAGVLPADLRAQVEGEMQKQTTNTVELPTSTPVLADGYTKAEHATTKEPTDEELLKMKPQDMTHAQLQRAFALKNSQ